jgi:uncharacterized surface protein with fasciclin (FAS1) repeats
MMGVLAGACLACAPTHQLTDTSSTVLALAWINPSIATFVTMIEASDVSARLRGSDPVTVLAPSNIALNSLGPDRVRFLLSTEGASELDEFVNAHVFPGAYSGEDVARGKLPRNLAGKRITASKAPDGTPRVEGTGKILESMKGSNGYVHIIDTVIR